MPSAQSVADSDFLRWVAERFIYVHGESPNCDFVQRLESIATKLEEDDEHSRL